MCKVSQFFYEQIKNSAFCFVALSCKILYNIAWLYETFIVLQKFYIEGINNLYEFSCGELSGWMYSVNNKFPQRGCSSYTLKNGDDIVWSYTCDLGRDIGAEFVEGQNGK